MNREIVVTGDGSPSIRVPVMNVTYHSIHGAIRESLHVYIEAGLLKVFEKVDGSTALQVLEVGFGTGLNALLSLMEAEKRRRKTNYFAVEPFPLEATFLPSLNYYEHLFRPDLKLLFEQLHNCKWDNAVPITPYFTISKLNITLQAFQINTPIHLVYFDAFAPKVQPELWTPEIFQLLFQSMSHGAILVTYSSKSDVRRAMLATGFQVEKIPGPPHKMEMLRATKP